MYSFNAAITFLVIIDFMYFVGSLGLVIMMVVKRTYLLGTYTWGGAHTNTLQTE